MFKKKASIIFKGLFVISCFFGLSLTSQDAPTYAIFLSYFTTQSNILCMLVMLLFFFITIYDQVRYTRFFRVLKASTTVAIMVTFLIYHFVLRPNMAPDIDNVAKGFGNLMVHYITPLWFLSDYLLFDFKGTTRWTDPFYYMIFPLYYFVFANVRAVTGDFFHYGSTISQFPYPFLDYLVYGNYGVSFAIIIITVAVLILGFVFVFFDHIMRKPKVQFHTNLYGTISYKPEQIENEAMPKNTPDIVVDLTHDLEDQNE
ncbi:MAG: Pr6Pr family membrane protein [Candidatus Izemoplasmatales bacterium]|nr:Pr6Pr family membrane protein [bacterium]MDZ4197307.1 Pr6Pr family membrane protein [Candidatus Izemoplasmatales bacterium]